MTLRSVLGVPAAYRTFTRLVGGRARQTHQSEFLRITTRDRVLDIGCGPGDILEVLPLDCEYIGFDSSSEYIEAAKRRYGDRARFECGTVTAGSLARFSGIDVVMANGVMHHLDDRQAHELLAIAHDAIGSTGRLVTIDGCYVAGQSRAARYLLSRDRGEYVRRAPEYEALARGHFENVRIHVRHDLLRIPHTHIIMECCR